MEAFKTGAFGAFQSPETHLATMVIYRAVLDACLLNGKDRRIIYGDPISRSGLMKFFKSRWCENLISFQDTITQKEIADTMQRFLYGSS